jgi:hypothetical protein
MKRETIVQCIGFAFLVMFMVGCSGAILTPTRTQPRSTFTPLATQTITLTPTPTATPTPSPTATPSFTPTLTPLPTLSSDEALEYVGELFHTNKGCTLPCWWGITPGQTLWADARRFLAQFAMFNKRDETKPQFSMDILVPTPKDISPIWMAQYYKIKDGKVETIRVEIGVVPEYTLSTFLATYGPPGEIWVSTYSTEFLPEGILFFFTILFYPDRGILAVYGPHDNAIVGDTVRGCRLEYPPTQFGLWSPVQKISFNEEIAELGLDMVLFRRLEEATDMDVQTFYENYLQPNSSTCIETPRNLWPEP